jgi:hypothetical protein
MFFAHLWEEKNSRERRAPRRLPWAVAGDDAVSLPQQPLCAAAVGESWRGREESAIELGGQGPEIVSVSAEIGIRPE